MGIILIVRFFGQNIAKIRTNAASKLPNGCAQPNQSYGRHLVHSGFRIILIYYLSILSKRKFEMK
jgi:hypothetical protein